MAVRQPLHIERLAGVAWEAAFALILLTQFGSSASGQSGPPWQLWKIDADGSHLALFADTPGYRCGSAQWSPDGTLVAFDTWRLEEDVAQSQVGVLPADGTGWRLIGRGGMPSWSPDGTQIVCHTYFNPRAVPRASVPAADTFGSTQSIATYMTSTETIDVMNADGSGRETIADHWGSPRWSPRGNRVFSIRPNGDFMMLDLAAGREQRIISGPYSVRQGFSISPDGLRFCFGDQTAGIGVATLDERTMQASVRWLVREGTCYHTAWAPDGHHVVYSWALGATDPQQLYIVDVDGGDKPRLLHGQDTSRRNVNPNWSPDGKTIIFSSQALDGTRE